MTVHARLRPLWLHQQDALKFALNKHGALLALSMGCG